MVEHVEAVLTIGHVDHVDADSVELGRGCEGLDGRGDLRAFTTDPSQQDR